MDLDTGATVGHLPMENSRTTKFLLGNDARVASIFTSNNYCVLPLVQGGLVIPYRVVIYMSPTQLLKTNS